MKSLLLAAAVTSVIGTACLADGEFWVTGNRATDRCDIVTSNPTIVGDIYFADGPYKSRDDAKLARSTINACPNKDDPKEDDPKQASPPAR
jgi:hypothetical protein